MALMTRCRLIVKAAEFLWQTTLFILHPYLQLAFSLKRERNDMLPRNDYRTGEQLTLRLQYSHSITISVDIMPQR